MQRNLVIIPTYNEIENISSVLKAVFSMNMFDVLVVDDSSPDGTANKVKQLKQEFPNQLFLEVRKDKQGLAQAYVHGFKWALSKSYDYIFEMDADFSHNPKDLPRLHESLKNGNDMVVGSRYCKGVNVVNWPMHRVLISYFASKYVKMILNLPISDSTAGFVGYKKEVLKSLDLNRIRLKGYGFQVEMKYKVWKKKFKIKEESIIFTDRVLGESKIDRSIIFEAIFGILYLRVRAMFNRL